MQALARVAQVVQCLDHHRRPQVRAAAADVHNVGDAIVSAHALGEGQHVLQRGVHVVQGRGNFRRYCIDSCLRLTCMPWRRFSQQPMHHRALLGVVDRSALEHRIAVGHHAAFTRQLQQQRFGGRVDQVLGQVRKHMRSVLAEALETLRILRKCGAQVEAAAGAFVMGTQALPRGRVVAAGAGIVKIHAAACISCSSLAASAANARMPSASFSVAMASALSA